MLLTRYHGIPLVAAPRQNAASTAIVARVSAGYAHDHPATRGTAHLVEHLIFEGSVRYPRPGDLEARAEAIGGYTGGFTTAHYTEYFVRVPNRHAGAFLDRLTDALLHPTLDAAIVEREAQILRREHNIEEADTLAQGLAAIYTHLGWAAPLAEPQTTDDATRAFHARWYQPQHICLSIVGRVPRSFRMGAAPGHAAVLQPAAGDTVSDEAATSCPVPLLMPGDTEDDLVLLAFPRPVITTPAAYGAANLLSVLLAGRTSALLPRRLRERGVCYDVASTVYHHPVGSLLVITAGVARGTGAAFLREVWAWWEEAARSGFGRRDYEAALSYYMGTTAMHFEHPRHYASYLCEQYALLPGAEGFEGEIAALRAMCPEDVRDIMRWFEGRRAVAVIVGKENEK